MGPGSDDPTRRPPRVDGTGVQVPAPRSQREQPIDLHALRADDALIDALAAGLIGGPEQRDTADPDAELIAMLAAWVVDVHPEPLRVAPARPVDCIPVSAAPTVRPLSARSLWARSRSARSLRVLPLPALPVRYGRFVAAAALCLLGSSGLVVGASNAVPGEPLWAVSKVFYAERARSVEAAVEVASGLEHARTALREGRRAEAAVAIAAAREQLDMVGPAEGHDTLVREHDLLAVIIADPSLPIDDSAAGSNADGSVLAAPPDPDPTENTAPYAAASLPVTAVPTGPAATLVPPAEPTPEPTAAEASGVPTEGPPTDTAQPPVVTDPPPTQPPPTSSSPAEPLPTQPPPTSSSAAEPPPTQPPPTSPSATQPPPTQTPPSADEPTADESYAVGAAFTGTGAGELETDSAPAGAEPG